MLRRVLLRPWAVITAVTVVTVALAAGVFLAITPTGCKLSGRCNSSLVASTHSPTPLGPPFQLGSPRTTPYSPLPTPSFEPTPSPTRNPSYPPYEYPSTSGLPPIYPDASSAWSSAGILSCRLPVYSGGPGSGGFITFPDGTYVSDPRSNAAPPSGAPQPTVYGPGASAGLTYDRPYDKWLPVVYRSVAPDGKSYAYAGQDGIYVVNVTNNTFAEVGQGHTWNVIDAESNGLYASDANAGGLWWFPSSGAATLITSQGYWVGVAGGAAYGTATSAIPQGMSNVILRLDVKTGATQNWFTVDGGTSTLTGFDSKGVPIIVSYSFSGDYTGNWVEVWSVPSVGGATVIADTPAVKATGFSGPVIGDSHGIWFGNPSAIFLWVQGDGLHRAAGVGGFLAGSCA